MIIVTITPGAVLVPKQTIVQINNGIGNHYHKTKRLCSFKVSRILSQSNMPARRQVSEEDSKSEDTLVPGGWPRAQHAKCYTSKPCRAAQYVTARGSARLGSARLGPARLGSARLGSARLGSARLGSCQWYSRSVLSHQRQYSGASLTLTKARCGGEWRPSESRRSEQLTSAAELSDNGVRLTENGRPDVSYSSYISYVKI